MTKKPLRCSECKAALKKIDYQNVYATVFLSIIT